MKHKIIAGLLAISLLVGSAGCGKNETSTTEEILLQGGSSKTAYDDINAGAAKKAASLSTPGNATVGDPQYKESEDTGFNYEDIPEYAGNAYISVNNDIPFFTESDFATECFVEYSNLDELGRCGCTTLVTDKEHLPHEERSDIGQYKPSGWKQNKYEGIVDSEPPYLYNRSHLGMFALIGNESNCEENLITGTRAFNTLGMLPNEMEVLDYVENSDYHVLYRVTPIFTGDDLLARGVLMEAASVEDQGESFHFCRWAYNVQPGIKIDYKTGENKPE